MNYDIAIIGCGLMGASCAYALSRYKLRIAVFEADNDVANGTSKANSAIVHAGYDPIPGTQMARLNVEGNALMEPLCRRLDVPYRKIGSLVLAFSEDELIELQKLYERGVINGVSGQQLLSRDATLAMEPNLSPKIVGALYAPTAGIVNPWELTLAMAETAVKNGTELYLNAPVIGVTRDNLSYKLTTPKGEFTAKTVLNCAGTVADKVASLLHQPKYTIQPSKGEYYLLDKTEGNRVSHVIFQCPSKAGKGVLVAPTVHGNLIVGPSATSSDPDDTANTQSGMDFVRTQALRSVPSIRFRDNIRNFAGVRANADQSDFVIEESEPGFIDVACIRSPGLTAAPAIGEEIVRMLQLTEKKEDYLDSRKRIRFSELSAEEKNALIAKNPLYGRIICRCETVTEGEIVASLHTPIPPVSVNGVKRRVGAGMGRCQGGFCGPRVQEIIARERHISPLDVPMDSPGTFVLTGQTKGDAVK